MTEFKRFVIISFGIIVWFLMLETGMAQEDTKKDKEPSKDRLEKVTGKEVKKEPSRGNQKTGKDKLRQKFSKVQLKVGQDAPDFELLSLEFEKDEKGEMVGTIGSKKVKLSAFKGKTPVCLFSSSYT